MVNIKSYNRPQKRSFGNVLLVGATSGIARSLARRLCARGCRLILAGRNVDELVSDAQDLRIRFQTDVFVETFDALQRDCNGELVRRCLERFDDKLDGAVICHGYLPIATEANTDPEETQRTIDINFTSVVSLLIPLANYFEKRRTGFIAVISSVAGDRGRQSNYAYGAAKAGLSAYLQGLRNRLYRSGARVLTIKPGMVNTRMTHGICNPSSPLVASPDTVARDIDRAIEAGRDVLYTPWVWAPIMQLIRLLPEVVFKRLRL